MKRWRLHFPVKAMSRLLKVSRSGFYAWLSRPPSRRQLEDERLKIAIKAAHERSRQTYGCRRLKAELASDGYHAGRDRIGRLRRELNLRCRGRRKFKVTTDSKHHFQVADNLLQRDFNATAPNQVWLADITYIPTAEGWLYLSGVKDIFTKEIVGYHMSDRLTQNLTGRALLKAVRHKKPPPGLCHHSDRGSQYCALDYRKMLERFGMRVSMSGRGNCYDNAPMESFWGSLKNELVYHQRYVTRQQAESSIREYIEIFYNRQRRHSALGYLSPAAFESEFYNQWPRAA